MNRLERMPQIDPSRQPLRETAGAPARPDSSRSSGGKVDAQGGHGKHHCNDGHKDCHDLDTHCNYWWGFPSNRYVCWSGFGFQSGYLFCGSSVYWYWWWPGYRPYFRPYSYYCSPYSYYLPAYYPTYSTVTYVHDYYDDDYASYAEPTYEPEPGAAPPDAAALLDAGWQAFRGGAYFEAVESFRQAVLADPDDAQAKIAFAQALFAIGNYPDAAFLMRRTIEILPDWPVLGGDPRAWYAEPDDHAEQMVALRGFLDRMPAEPAATLVLGVQSYFTGDLTAAREAFALLAALDPDDRVAQRFLQQLGPVPSLPAAPASKDER